MLLLLLPYNIVLCVLSVAVILRKIFSCAACVLCVYSVVVIYLHGKVLRLLPVRMKCVSSV